MNNWENDLNINEVKEIRTRTTVYFGCGAIQKIKDIAKLYFERGIDKVIVMSGKNAYKSTGAWAVVEKALKENSIEYVNYDKVTPNPTTVAIDEAAKLAANHSKAKSSSNIPVDYCLVQYVKKVPGNKPGLVIYRNNKTIYV